MKELRHIIYGMILALGVIALLHTRGYLQGHSPVSDTTHITIVDTVVVYRPVARDSVVVRYVVEKLPLASDIRVGSKVQMADSASVGASENLLCKQDTTSVVIPITRKVYQDSTYRAVVSGYRPELEEIAVFPRREVVIITTATKPKRWSIGVQAGCGVTLESAPRLVPYIGVGVQYSLFSF